ncbi:MAG TPA: flagellar hook-associated protein FlgK [Epulopiscium sp.]|nr:flagellar hook-associated protein FlgK [Candidatus Epulonipiscium sp.]
MSSIASLGRMVSALNASQRGLQATSHNITNANTPGYIRQQLLQHDSQYANIGNNGGQLQQVGIGVTMTEMRQIRDEFADRRFRTENSVLSYYQTKKAAVDEMEIIFGEPHGEALSKTLNDFWSQTQKLATNPAGIEERMAFIQSADVLVKQANHIQNQLIEYQYNLDTQVRDTVKNVNNLVKGIQSLNESISYYEIGGDNANDLRDQRNVLLDELSGIMDINYREERDGRVIVTSEGVTLLDGQFRAEMTTAQTEAMSPFVKPVWKNTGMDVYRMDRAATSISGRDTGQLRSLLMMRGNSPANAQTEWDEIAINDNLSVDSDANAFLIPRIQKEFDIFVQALGEMVNGIFNPADPDAQPSGQGVHAGEKGISLFVPINPALGMVAGNLQVNPLLLESGGYNRLPTSMTGDESDTTVIEKLLGEWNKDIVWFSGGGDTDPTQKTATLRAFYSELIAELGAEGSEAKGRTEEKVILITDIENARQSMGGVSTDEEMTSMMKYQYSYNAAARMITMLDGMMDTVINRMGI